MTESAQLADSVKIRAVKCQLNPSPSYQPPCFQNGQYTADLKKKTILKIPVISLSPLEPNKTQLLGNKIPEHTSNIQAPKASSDKRQEMGGRLLS